MPPVDSTSAKRTHSLRPIKRNTAPTQVVETILQAIRNGDFADHGRLPVEHELCALLGVGRNTLREAIRFLEMAGVLQVRPGGGTFIVTDETRVLANTVSLRIRLTPGSALQIIESRRVIESAMAGFAAERAAEHDRARLTEALERMRNAQDIEAFAQADVAYHIILADASHNVILRHMIDALRDGMSDWIHHVLLLPDSRPVAFEDHVRIHQAILARDAAGSRAAMDAHLLEVGRRLVTVMGVDDGPGAVEVPAQA